MTQLPLFLEFGLVVVMVVWSVGTVICALPSNRLRRALFRKNWGLWFANWSVFGAARDRSEVCVYVLEYRDNADAAAQWVEASCGRGWRWHSGLWQPERRVADRIHRIGQDIAFRLEQDMPPVNWLIESRRLLERYLEATCPPQPGAAREIRLRMRRSICEAGAGRPLSSWPIRVEERVLLQFVSGCENHGA